MSSTVSTNGYRWRKPPPSTPPFRPKRRNSEAIHSAVLSNPGLGVFRPCMESWAMTPIRQA